MSPRPASIQCGSMTPRLGRWLPALLAAAVFAGIPSLARTTVDRTASSTGWALALPTADSEVVTLLATPAPIGRPIAVVQADVDRDDDLDLVVTTDTFVDLCMLCTPASTIGVTQLSSHHIPGNRARLHGRLASATGLRAPPRRVFA
jgi:hypothetical protein